jgi:hypothetical protein
MKKNRKPSLAKAFSARGRNGMDAFSYYKFRKFYKDMSYPDQYPDYGVHGGGFGEEPSPIDLWYDKPLFGKFDLAGNPIYLSEANLKQLSAPSSNETFFAIDFVVDAFQDLQLHFSKALAQKKLDPNFKLAKLSPSQAWISATNLHHDFIMKTYEVFIGTYIQDNNLHCQIETFEDFLKFFMLFMKEYGTTMPFTRTGFIASKYCPLNISGLIIDLENTNLGDDAKKISDLLSQPSFSFYISSAKNHGFLVDKNVPSRLVADMSNPKMIEHMQKYNVGDTREVLKRYYYKPYKRDIETMVINLVEFYNGYVKTRPYSSKTLRRYGHGDMGSVVEQRSKTLTRNKFRNPINKLYLRSRYTLDELIDIYFLLRTYEVNSKMSEFAKRDVIQTALKRRRVFGFDSAITYINEKINEEIKIDLTISSHYVKGNNAKAKQIQKAYSNNEFNKEPNIRDVISGDYNRK